MITIGQTAVAVCVAVAISIFQLLLRRSNSMIDEKKAFRTLEQLDETLMILTQISDKAHKLKSYRQIEEKKWIYDRLQVDQATDSFLNMVESSRDWIMSCLDLYDTDRAKGLKVIRRCIKQISPSMMVWKIDIETLILRIEKGRFD